MGPYRRGDDRNLATDRGGDPADGVAGGELLRPEHGDGTSREPRVGHRGSSEPDDVGDIDRPEARWSQTDQRKDRERVERSAHVVEQVVAAAIDHARLQDGVIDPGSAHELLGGPLRLVIWRAARGSSAQEAQVADLARSARSRGVADRALAAHVHALVRLGAYLAVDAREVRDRVAPSERSAKDLVVIGRSRDEVHAAPEDRRIAPIDTPCDDDHLVAVIEQRDREVTADETGPTRDGDLHTRRAVIARRWRTCVGQTALR